MTYPRATFWLAVALLFSCADDLVLFEPVEPGPDVEDATSPTTREPIDAAIDVNRVHDAGMDAGLDADIHEPTSDAGRETEGPDTILPRPIAAFSQTCVIRSGKLYCFGDNRVGQCGGATDAGAHPHELAGTFVEVCAGEHHSCALRTDGSVMCWGSNRSGQLGVGDDAPRMSPTTIPELRFRAIACGGDSSCAIDLEGALFCWGDHFEGKLGTGSGISPGNSFSPQRVADLNAKQVSVGQGHTCAIDRASALYCWGRNTNMQVGVAATDPQLRTPQRVDPAFTYLHVSAAQEHSCAIRIDGRLMCWGNGAPRVFEGPQPIGPRLIEEDPGYDVVFTGWFHSCARKRGALNCWGRNTEGQLGLGDQAYRVMPTQVGTWTNWNDITVGQFHTCGTRDGELYCWGDNTFGQLGPADRERRYRPSLVKLP